MHEHPVDETFVNQRFGDEQKSEEKDEGGDSGKEESKK